MACIIHDKFLGSYPELKHVTTNTEIRFRKAKAIIEYIKGENYHEEQCNKIPSIIDIAYGVLYEVYTDKSQQ